MSQKNSLGKYKILDQIGSGGMAIVYKAYQDSLDRLVAVKELKASLTEDPQVLERFEREARAAAKLQHENIIHIYDYEAHSKSAYIVMEYLEGVDLAKVLEAVKPLPTEIAAIIAFQICRALEYAHQRGLVHRDIKPSNIMISRGGEVKLMDFGIARDTTQAALTLPGTFLGTPNYMSPEQVLGERVDFRSDLFSLGIVMYEMLTGYRPFKEDDKQTVFDKIRLSSYVSPAWHNRRVSWFMRWVIWRCLKKKSLQRFQDTADLRRKLEQHLLRRYKILNTDHVLQEFLEYSGVFEQEKSTQGTTVQKGRTYVSRSRARRRWKKLYRAFRLSTVYAGLVAWYFFAHGFPGQLYGAPWNAGVAWWVWPSDHRASRLILRGADKVHAFVDGRYAGTMPPDLLLTLPAGEHALVFRMPRQKTIERSVTLRYARTLQMTIDLELKKVEKIKKSLLKKEQKKPLKRPVQVR